jgi:hypothetical protein
MPHHSDIDVLIVTATAMPEPQKERLINDTYLLFLEYGRQIDPKFRTLEQFRELARRGEHDFDAHVLEEGRRIYP